MSVARRNKATKYCIDEVTRNINYSILVSLLITKAGGGEGGGGGHGRPGERLFSNLSE